jgi:poly-gamma-glutamate capsule biosynthesis protein CapA/YwtB (metallophosphatase superfamily)
MRSQKRKEKADKTRLLIGLLTAIAILLVLTGLSPEPYIKSLKARYESQSVDPQADTPVLIDHPPVIETADKIMAMRGQTSRDELNLIFLGDTMMTGKVAEAMKRHGLDYPLREFALILEEADFIVVNLETAVGYSGELMEKTYAFQTDPKYLDLFMPYREKLLFTLANNHGMDGPLSETMNALEAAGFQYVGVGDNLDEAFQPYVNEINGVSFAIFGASQVIPSADWRATEHKAGMATAYHPEPLVSYLEGWTERVDYVITYLHWGTEREDQPNENQLKLEEALKDAGVNLIIGSHPHVLQAIEWNNDRQMTAYSIGNFVFTTSHHPASNDTAALKISLSSGKIEAVKAYPAEIRWGLVRVLTEPEERDRIFQRIQMLSESIEVDRQGNLTRKKIMDQ